MRNDNVKGFSVESRRDGLYDVMSRYEFCLSSRRRSCCSNNVASTLKIDPAVPSCTRFAIHRKLSEVGAEVMAKYYDNDWRLCAKLSDLKYLMCDEE
jgi:hypothetical protein